MGSKWRLSEEAWSARLEPEAFRVLRKAGTERAFSGAHWDEHREGVYRCAGCGQVLYRSQDKFESGTGWPSFFATAEASAITTRVDRTLWMKRTELLCSRCGGHLGHLFEDGPKPTGERHCINSAALTFEVKKGTAEAGSPAPVSAESDAPPR